MSPLMCSSLVAFQQQQQQLLLLLFDLDCKYDFLQPEIVCQPPRLTNLSLDDLMSGNNHLAKCAKLARARAKTCLECQSHCEPLFLPSFSPSSEPHRIVHTSICSNCYLIQFNRHHLLLLILLRLLLMIQCLPLLLLLLHNQETETVGWHATAAFSAIGCILLFCSTFHFNCPLSFPHYCFCVGLQMLPTNTFKCHNFW